MMVSDVSTSAKLFRRHRRKLQMKSESQVASRKSDKIAGTHPLNSQQLLYELEVRTPSISRWMLVLPSTAYRNNYRLIVISRSISITNILS